jgi:hypothetical protein
MLVRADVAPEIRLAVEGMAADHDPDAAGILICAQLAHHRGHPCKVKGHCRGKPKEVWLALRDISDQRRRRQIGAQMVSVPSFHLEEIGNHPHPELVDLARRARRHQDATDARPGKEMAIAAP